MKRFIEGEDRNQSTLFPECLDEADSAVCLNPHRSVPKVKRGVPLGKRHAPLTPLLLLPLER